MYKQAVVRVPVPGIWYSTWYLFILLSLPATVVDCYFVLCCTAADLIRIGVAADLPRTIIAAAANVAAATYR
jgi:hypothetical protein